MPSRGLRQGRPLPPYLFVFCMDKLGQWLQKRVAEGQLKKVRALRYGPRLNYLFFADDLLLFSQTCEDQLRCIKEGLQRFCDCSWQKIKFLKSSMLCSVNAAEEEARSLSASMGILLATKLVST